MAEDIETPVPDQEHLEAPFKVSHNKGSVTPLIQTTVDAILTPTLALVCERRIQLCRAPVGGQL